MNTVIVQHQVADFDSWLVHFVAHADKREAAGFRNVRVHRAAGDPNNVYIIGQGDPQQLSEFFNSPQLAELMREAGVQGAPTVHVLDEGADH